MTTKGIGWKNIAIYFLIKMYNLQVFCFVNDLKNLDFFDVGLPLQNAVGITTIVSKSAPLKSS